MINWTINVVTADDGTTKTWQPSGVLVATADECEAHLETLLRSYSDVEAVAPGGFTLESRGGKIFRSDTVNAR